MSSEPFDPYRQWLNIEDPSRPLDHYTLLGIARFESDPQAINQAADVQLAKVRRIRPGERLGDWGRLLDQIEAVKVCLLDPAAKASYDANLQGASPTQAGPAAPAAAGPSFEPPPPEPLAPPVEGFASAPAVPRAIPIPPAEAGGSSEVTARQVPASSPMPGPPRAVEAPSASRKRAKWGRFMLIGVLVLALAGLGVAFHTVLNRPVEEETVADLLEELPEEPTPPETTPEETEPEDATSEDAVAEGAVLEDAVSEDAVSPEDDPQEEMLEDASPTTEPSEGVESPSQPVVEEPVDAPVVESPAVESPAVDESSTAEDGSVAEKDTAEVEPTPDDQATSPLDEFPDDEAPPTSPSVVEQPPVQQPVEEQPATEEPPAEEVVEETPAKDIDSRKAAAFKTAVAAARKAMSHRDLATAKQELAKADKNLQTNAEVRELDRLETIHGYLGQFWEGILKSMSGLESGAEMEVGSTRVIVVEVGKESITMRVNGRNRTYTVERMPYALVKHIGSWAFTGDSASKVVVGAFFLMDADAQAEGGREQARKLWKQAAAEGIEMDDLMVEIDHK